jgi:hypothetical protein
MRKSTQFKRRIILLSVHAYVIRNLGILDKFKTGTPTSIIEINYRINLHLSLRLEQKLPKPAFFIISLLIKLLKCKN